MLSLIYLDYSDQILLKMDQYYLTMQRLEYVSSYHKLTGIDTKCQITGIPVISDLFKIPVLSQIYHSTQNLFPCDPAWCVSKN